MKTIRYISIVLNASIIFACSKDDSTTVPPVSEAPIEIPSNKAPGSFNLIDIEDDSDNIDLRPTFSWQAAVDPDGDAVTYDLYLGTEPDATQLYAENLSGPNFTVTDRLFVIADYYWKVVAKDAKGATVSSAINTFTTRNLNFPSEPVTDNAGFSVRTGHTSVVFNGKIYVLGGFYPSEGYLNDVWSSTDGDNWTRVTPSGPITRNQFPGRSNHTTVVFDDKLWVIGGYNSTGDLSDVWYSTNGSTWTMATDDAAFSKKSRHTSVVFENKLWVIGGRNESSPRQNDVWYSDDGVTWTNATMEADFSPRYWHASVVFDNRLWVIGGGNGAVWSSSDGVQWQQATSAIPFPEINSHISVVFDNKMWVIGGYTTQPENRVWYSGNGVDWIESDSTAGFSAKEGAKGFVFDDNIWVIGGFDGLNTVNDVWTLD